MMSKYGYEISNMVLSTEKKRLINQIWKLIPMRENDEDWLKQIDSVIIEINGLQAIFKDCLSFLIILSSLEGIRALGDNSPFDTFRRTIFEVIDAIGSLLP